MKGKAITLRSTDPTDGNVVLATIIDGTGEVFPIITCVSGETPNTVIDGFFITNGRNFDFPGGGAMYINGSSPTVRNCTFSRNRVEEGFSAGGAIQMWSASVIISNCAFIENTAWLTGGGAIYTENSTLKLSNCTFIGNMAWNEAKGGAILSWNSDLEVINCTFSGNITIKGLPATPFSGSGQGGAIAIYSYGPSPSTLLITGSVVRGNRPNTIEGPYTDGGGNSLGNCPPPRPVVQGDVDGDGDVDLRDFVLIVENWLVGVE